MVENSKYQMLWGVALGLSVATVSFTAIAVTPPDKDTNTCEKTATTNLKKLGDCVFKCVIQANTNGLAAGGQADPAACIYGPLPKGKPCFEKYADANTQLLAKGICPPCVTAALLNGVGASLANVSDVYSNSSLYCGCASGQTNCDGSCVDTASDPNNCGGCSQQCATGGTCTAGTCGCPSGQTDCGGTCVDTSTDANNCGGCGSSSTDFQCVSPATCSGGTCSQGCCQGLLFSLVYCVQGPSTQTNLDLCTNGSYGFPGTPGGTTCSCGPGPCLGSCQ